MLDNLFPCFALVACSVAHSARVLTPLAIAFSTASGNTSFNAVRTTSCNPGASCVITVPVSIAIGLTRPGLTGKRRLEGESLMTVLWQDASRIPALTCLIAPT